MLRPIMTNSSIATWMSEMPLSERNRSNRRCRTNVECLVISAASGLARRRGRIRCVNHTAAALNLAPNVTRPREEPLLQGRKRRDFIRIERPHELRRDQHQKLRLLRALGLGAEEVSDDRQPRQSRNFLKIVLRQVVEKTRHGKRLPVA